MNKKNKPGTVYIIGAGPGDAGLITVKGADCLGRADVVVYDYLVNEELLEYARSAARFIYAGKKGGEHTLPQDKINELLVREAQDGNTVARLKGGDPFIFGRGGEEAEELARNNVPFEIIPGVTSAVAVPAYAGIPLTHRGFTSTVAFVTGHEDPAKEKSDIDWPALAGIGTLVFLMGVKNIDRITDALIKHGKSPSTPVALIRWGTTSRQEVITATLAAITGRAEAGGFAPPAILVVGDVVDLRETLKWFDGKPLFGKGIVITRPEREKDDLAALLTREGARVICFPTIKITPPPDWSGLDAAVTQLNTYHWIIFTSANGVHYFFERLAALGKDIRELKNIKICCIGPATAFQIQVRGIGVDLIPEYYISEGILKSFARLDLTGQKILIPRAVHARDVLPEGLAKMGAAVDVVAAYETVNSGRKKEQLLELIRNDGIDVITFTSTSTVTNFLEIMGGDFICPAKIRIACIGPITEAAARRAGFNVDIRQDEYTVEGLVQSLVQYFKNEQAAESGKSNNS